MTIVHKPTIIIEELGEVGVLPAGGIINAGGVAGPTFTVGGRDVVLAGIGSGGGVFQVVGYEHIQATSLTLWTINHNKNSTKVQVTIWDPTNEMVLADIVKIVDPDTITVKFNTPLSGRAILMLF